MIFIVLFIIAVVSMFVLRPVAQKTKVPIVLFLMLLGILLGSSGIYDLFGLLDGVNPELTELNTLSTYAIVILFVVSGMGIDIKKIKSGGKNSFALSTIPVFTEVVIMSLFTIVLFKIIPLELFDFGAYNYMTVMTIFAMSSPAIILPIVIASKAKGKTSKIFDEMTVASIVDNLIPMPLVIVFFLLSLSQATGEGTNGLVITIIMVLFAFVMATIIGLILGSAHASLRKGINMTPLISAIILIAVTLFVVFLMGPLGSSTGILIGLGAGVGYNATFKDLEKKGSDIKMASNIYGLLFMPLVFIAVGTQVQLDLLLNPINIILLSIVTIVAIYVKGTASKLYLKTNGYTLAEQKISGTFFAAKGIILVNLSLVLGPGLTSVGLENVLQYMYVLAAISIIISVPYSIVKSNKLVEEIN